MELQEKIASILDEDGNEINRIMLHKDEDPANWGAVWDDFGNLALLADAVRIERDKRLREEVDAIVLNSLRYDALTDEEKTQLAERRQFLLDIPQQEGFPEVVDWG